MKRMLILLAALLAGGCGADQAPDAKAAPKVEVPIVEAAPAELSKDLLKEVSVLMIGGDLEAKLSMVQLDLVLKGAKMEGTPETLPDFWLVAGERGSKLHSQYTTVISKLPTGDLRTALKDCFTAEIRFYANLTSTDTSDGQRWLNAVKESKLQRDEAAVALETEVRLARG